MALLITKTWKAAVRAVLPLVYACLPLCSCKSDPIMNIPVTAGAIGSMDIPSPAFFWQLKPWEPGTLATIDGYARFAKLSFEGGSRIRIEPLADFPKMPLDNQFVVSSKAKLCLARSAKRHHIADIASGKTKSFAPLLNWNFRDGDAMILDETGNIVLFDYLPMDNSARNYYHVYYDQKNDLVIREEENAVSPLIPFTPEIVLSQDFTSGDGELLFYNWKTGEKTRNGLTKKLNAVEHMNGTFAPGYTFAIKKRFLLVTYYSTSERNDPRPLKITWDEDYEEVQLIPLDYLVPEKGKRFVDFFLSENEEWATTLFGSYRGLYREILYKRVFFHLDGRYPNGISIPVFTEDLQNSGLDLGSFVEHPEYGWCFAEEKYRVENEKEKEYLRLYKMSDVADEINRRLREAANGAFNN